MNVEVFDSGHAVIGEGPMWCARSNALYWIDIGGRQLHRRSLDGQVANWRLPGRPGCVERRDDGLLVIAMGEGLHAFDPATGALSLMMPVPLGPGQRFNEGKVDPRGRLLFGSMQDNMGPNGEAIPLERWEGKLFCVDNGDLAILDREIGISNTVAFSPDNRLLYFADSLRNAIYVYDYDIESGAATNRRVFFDEDGLGLPDGSAIDTDGCLWNARWGAGMILRITPDGRIDRRIELPVTQPTSCAFGGPDLDTLFVTSACGGLDEGLLASQPLNGGVLAIAGLAKGMAIPEMRWQPG